MWYCLSCRKSHTAPGQAKNTQYIYILISNVSSEVWIWCCCLNRSSHAVGQSRQHPGLPVKGNTVGYQHQVAVGSRVPRIPLNVPKHTVPILCMNADGAPNPPATYTQIVPHTSAKNKWSAYGVWLFMVQVKWCKGMGRLHSLRAFW